MIRDDYYQEDRKRYLKNILESNAEKKLIIAGPGTGKTYTFKKLLEKYYRINNKKGLVLTFIKNLVNDLEQELDGLAEVRTFHSFCRSEIIKIKGRAFEYYPHLLSLIKKDLLILGASRVIKKDADLDNYFYELNVSKIQKILEIADYYNAGGHTDSVYRVYKYYERYADKILSYPIVLIDEYQDFNLLETKIVEKLAEKNHILIVGDDDQALYIFRKSSPRYLRELVNNNSYERFELPYCSRCPQVIIKAVNNIIEISKRNGYLKGRIEKPFKYFPPDKKNDSAKNPRIIYAHCTVENKNCRYAGKFILNEIFFMPQEYKEDAIRKNEPAAMVIGPKQFLNGVITHFEKVKTEYSQWEFIFKEKEEAGDLVHVLDGYEILLRNPESNLGWRIVLGNNNQNDFSGLLRYAITERKHIVDILNEDTRRPHIELLNILKKIRAGSIIDKCEEDMILSRLKLPINEIRRKFVDGKVKDEISMDNPASKPQVLCTTFEGSKGLAAQYVFIIGFNEGHFPRKNPPNDIDICRLIVGLTRTRRRAYVISYGLFGKDRLRDSIFLTYLDNFLSEKIYVDKGYIKTITGSG